MPALTALLPITTPLALIAFIMAAALYAYRAYLVQRRRMIAGLPANDQLSAIEATLTRFRVDTTNMTSVAKRDLALAQIRAQAQRFLIGAIVICILAVIAAAVSIASLPAQEQNGMARPPPAASADAQKTKLEDCLKRARASNPTTDQMITAAKSCEADAR